LQVDSSFRIKICDFGFARAADSKEFMTMCGTDEWMAPEVILGDKYDESADVFSFGVIIAELITYVVDSLLHYDSQTTRSTDSHRCCWFFCVGIASCA
jgi:serine/threonine protein kinase